MNRRARSLTVGVNYNTPPSKVISVLSSLLEQVHGLPAEPRSQARIVGYADFTIQYEIRYFGDTP